MPRLPAWLRRSAVLLRGLRNGFDFLRDAFAGNALFGECLGNLRNHFGDSPGAVPDAMNGLACFPGQGDAVIHLLYALLHIGYGHIQSALDGADLDECHGHTHTIDWDGRRVAMYHYHATWDFPYSAGCMRGSYRMSDVMKLSGPPPPGMDGRPGPPPGGHPDLNAAAGKLGISVARLHAALGPPPPDLDAAAAKLGIPVEQLRGALGVP